MLDELARYALLGQEINHTIERNMDHELSKEPGNWRYPINHNDRALAQSSFDGGRAACHDGYDRMLKGPARHRTHRGSAYITARQHQLHPLFIESGSNGNDELDLPGKGQAACSIKHRGQIIEYLFFATPRQQGYCGRLGVQCGVLEKLIPRDLRGH